MRSVFSTRLLPLSAAFITASTFALSVNADDDHDHEHHEAHVHGEAELFVSYENHQLNIVFESPAMNIVGFEHEARSDADRKKAELAKTLFESPDKLFEITSGTCSLLSSDLNFTAILDDDNDHGHEHKGHKHDHHDDHESEHSDISANYVFKCAKGDSKLPSLSVNLFKFFPGVEKVDAKWITEHKQGAKHLHKNQQRLDLK